MTDANVDVSNDSGLILPEKWYARLKWFVQIVIPAFSTLYFTLGSAWGWPNVEQVIGTCVALALFLGTVLGVSTNKYNKSEGRFGGELVITTNENGVKLHDLQLNGDPDELENMSEITFKVSS